MDIPRELGKVLLVLGVALVAVGAWLTLGARLPFRLGRLPGDLVWQGKRTTFYFPVVTCIALSVGVTLILRLVAWLRR